MLVQSREFKNAHFIVNSLRLSCLGNDGSIAKIPGFQNQLQRFHPLHFDKPVSPRLSAHTLLHGLIRSGLSIKAYQLADLLMRQDVTLRSASLHAVTTALLASSSSSDAATPDPPTVDQPNVLTIRPSIIADPCTRHAVRLFLRAREYRQRRSQNTYQSLIEACLLQGEILVASLLFVMVVKDWQLRKQVSAHFRGDPDDTPLPPAELESRARLRRRRAEYLRPDPKTMHSILFSIDHVLSQDPHDKSDQLAFQCSLQALANLAALLDERQLPFPQIAPLIRVLYSVPRVENDVWILQQDKPRRKKAHPFFHHVLEQLINSLLDDPSAHVSPDRHAYNTMLTYALRQRCSPTLAQELLARMKEKWLNKRPDLVTHNILLRSGTLIRNPEVTNQALNDLHQGMVVIGPSSAPKSTLDETPTSSSYVQPVESENSDRSVSLDNPNAADVQPAEPSPDEAHRNPIQADPYTLSTYISYLTSTGRPHVVAEILFRVLPELAFIDHPSWGSLPAKQRRRLRALSRQKCIRRAATHGPYFFTTVLNALRKAGRTGLAERVWHLAKEAERVSWIPQFMPKTGPWCLPVHAYTVMIQCYVAEARAGLRHRRTLGGSSTLNWSLSDDQAQWAPTTKRYVRGWAHFIIRRQKLARSNLCRNAAGRHMGMLLFHSMKLGAHDVYRSLLKVNHLDTGQWRDVQIPIPDARFFNAALELSSHHLQRPRRRTRASRAYWRQRFKQTALRYAQHGKLPRRWNPMLHEIAQEMVNAGYDLPPALRYLFVGRWLSGSSSRKIPEPMDRQPFFFAPLRPDSSQLHRIRTVNTRGRVFLGRRRRRRITPIASTECPDVDLVPLQKIETLP